MKVRFVIIALIAVSGLQLPNRAGEPTRISFNRDVRPILSDTCFHCHGFDQKSRMAGLRLDLREEAIKETENGIIPIVPGNPAGSAFIERVFSSNADDVMPPVESHKELTAAQKETLRRWVAQGAVYEPHWAYVPLAKPTVPQNGNPNPVDAFIREKLASRRITPSSEAPRAKLLRRLSLDLVGLPPTPEEVSAFTADMGPDAYERQVDRLLKSPHFGERMAVWWLDIARFADTVGYHGDQNQRIFPYRDYVIDSFNTNKRFDQFTIEQLAGDLLPNPTTEQLVATGYNRLTMMTREGGAQPKEYLAKYELRDIDPANRLLASQNPRRIEAEFVRDNALFIAGLLNVRDVGGPSVQPYQPEGYYESLTVPERVYVNSRGPEQWRRGVYMHWQRTFLHPMLANFDAPARDECAAQRNVSNTPQQALTLLNDPTFVEAARLFAARLLAAKQDASDDERIEHAFQLAVARSPKPKEAKSLKEFLGSQREQFAADPSAAAKLLKIGQTPPSSGNALELAAWTSLCRVLLNLQEVITRY